MWAVLHTDSLKDLKQKLLLGYLAVALPREASSLGMFVGLESRSRSAGWRLGFQLPCAGAVPMMWRLLQDADLHHLWCLWGMDPQSGYCAELLHISWAAVTVPDCWVKRKIMQLILISFHCSLNCARYSYITERVRLFPWMFTLSQICRQLNACMSLSYLHNYWISRNHFPLHTSVFLDLAKMGMKQIKSDRRNWNQIFFQLTPQFSNFQIKEYREKKVLIVLSTSKPQQV